VAIVGPPNSGKSTLFNRLTGLRQKVANYPGVTVEQHVGRVRLAQGHEILLIDLPGLYSLTPRSEDEQVARDILTGEMQDGPRPEAVLLVLDSTHLARHLTLAAPILALGLPCLVVLNMADELLSRGGAVDAEALSRELGAPVALISAAQGEGLEAVRDFLRRWGTAPALTGLPVLYDVPRCRAWATRVGQRASYQAPRPSAWTRRLDAVFLHPRWGVVIFGLVVVAVFQAIFSWARPLTDAVQWAIGASGARIGALLPDSVLRSLVVEGVWSGVGSVLVFLPQILLLFAFLGILEDSGYLARAALIADRTMARVGLQGKSFIPLLSAHACAAPAILATRTIENRRDRIATILIAPLMTCTARLPVYTLVIAAFLPERPLLGPLVGTRAAAILGLYLLGFVAAFATARLLKSSILRSDPTPFVLEMPPYRRPTFRSLALRLLDRSKVFLRRAGTVILAVALVMWLLAHLPLAEGRQPPLEHSFLGQLGRLVEPVVRPLGFNWAIGVGLVSSLAAREAIVGTLGTIHASDPQARALGLQEALRKDLTPSGAVALLVFFALAMPCLTTVGVVARETRSWKWPLLQFAYLSALAYGGAFLANRLAGLLG
jgi:ferrous iron transport protein B